VRRRKGPPLLASRRSGESGQALLELALVTPILVLLVMAIFQFAFVLQTQMGLENALREAARRAAATTTKNPTWSALRAWTLEQLNGDGTPANPGLLPQNVQGYDATRLWPAPYPSMSNTTTPAVSFCSYSAAGATNYRVKLTVEYSHPLFFGVMAFATDLVDGTENGSWDLGAAAEMRLQNANPTDINAAGNDPGACP
jgi:TadE-like protein